MTDLDRFATGLAFACKAHRGHVCKGTAIPYVSHLLAVSGLVLEHGGDGRSGHQDRSFTR
jgi:(p)ppGpp synthase/HD superfamily hydrolase